MRSLKAKLIVFAAILLAILSTCIAALVYNQMRSSIVTGVENELSGTANGYGTLSKAGTTRNCAPWWRAIRWPPSGPCPHLARINEGGFSLTYVGFADHHIVYSDGHAQKPGYDPVKRPVPASGVQWQGQRVRPLCGL
jgi:methyl-accepting chemotaxis protein